MGRDEQRQKLQRAVASNLEQTLYTLEGVREARVHINLPERDPLLGREITPGSASVLIIFEGPRSVAGDDVAQLVAGAAGIPRAAVSVLASQVEAPSNTAGIGKKIGVRMPEAVVVSGAAESEAPRVANADTTPDATVLTTREPASRAPAIFADPLQEIALSLIVLGLAGAFTILRGRANAARSADDVAKATQATA